MIKDKMKKIASFALAMVTLVSCQFVSFNGKAGNLFNAKGPVVVKTMEGLTDFDAITVNGSADVEFVQGSSFLVEVTTNEDVFEKLDFKVENGVLVLQPKEKVKLNRSKVNVKVVAPVLTEVNVNGAADFDMDSYEGENRLKIQVNGAGDLKLDDVIIPELKVVVNGAGDINFKDIDIEEVSVTVNGAGDAVMSGKAGNVDVTISGAGDVDLSGLAYQKLNTHKNGIGRIKR